MTKQNIEQWQVKESVRVLDHRWAKVRRDRCILPDGREIDDYYYWEGGDFAQVFALTPENLVILVRQYKHGVKEIVLELPAGMIEATDANPLMTVQRELLEETGCEGDLWQPLGILHVSSAKATTRAYPFLAQNIRQVREPILEKEEAVQTLFYPMPELLGLIAEGAIQDSHSIATCLLALQTLGKI